MRIAIVGASYMGLSVAWNIINLSQGAIAPDIFDLSLPDSDISSPVVEILSSFFGKNCEKGPFAEAASDAVHRLVMASRNSKYPSSILAKEVLKLAETDEQIEIFQQAAQKFPKELKWLPKQECEQLCPHLVLPKNGGGLLIQNSITLNSSLYLQGLQQACFVFCLQSYTDNFYNSFDDFRSYYDHIIVTDNPHVFLFTELQSLPLEKEDLNFLEVTFTDNHSLPPFSVLGNHYLLSRLNHSGHNYFLGKSCNPNYLSETIDPDTTNSTIWNHVNPVLPSLKDKATQTNSYAGSRIKTANNIPIMGQTLSKLWFCIGSGGDGFFYHGLAGKLIAQAVLTNNTSYIPKEFLYPAPS